MINIIPNIVGIQNAQSATVPKKVNVGRKSFDSYLYEALIKNGVTQKDLEEYKPPSVDISTLL